MLAQDAMRARIARVSQATRLTEGDALMRREHCRAVSRVDCARQARAAAVNWPGADGVAGQCLHALGTRRGCLQAVV